MSNSEKKKKSVYFGVSAIAFEQVFVNIFEHICMKMFFFHNYLFSVANVDVKSTLYYCRCCGFHL